LSPERKRERERGSERERERKREGGKEKERKKGTDTGRERHKKRECKWICRSVFFDVTFWMQFELIS